MKVIIDVQDAAGQNPPRSGSFYVSNLTRALLARNNLDYELVYWDYKKERGNKARAEQFFGEFNVPMHEINDVDYRLAVVDDKAYGKRSYDEISSTNGDIIHFTERYIPTNTKGILLATMHDAYVYTPEAPILQYSHGYAEKVRVALRRLIDSKPYLVTISEFARQQIIETLSYPEEKVFSVLSSVNKEVLYPDKSDISYIVDRPYFLHIGLNVVQKNKMRLLDAFKIFSEKHKDIKMVFVGQQLPHEYCVNESKYAEDLGIKNKVIFTGFVSESQKRQLYSNAIALAFPSLNEGFGAPLIEAQCCGCPVIVSNTTACPEVCGEGAFYVNPLSVEEIAIAMEKLLIDSSLRTDLIQRGFKNSERFSWDKAAEGYENVYRAIYKNGFAHNLYFA